MTSQGDGLQEPHLANRIVANPLVESATEQSSSDTPNQQSNISSATSRKAIGISPDRKHIEILGVDLPIKSVCTELSARVPEWSRFQNDILTDFDLRMMQKIAVAIDLNLPLLIEGGSGLGKSQTVDRVCSLCKWPSFYANCQDFTSDVLIGAMTTVDGSQTGFGWVDGVVLQAIRSGGILFLDEYNFMRGDTRGRLHEILDSVLRGKPTVTLIENGGEVVPVHPDFRIIAAQNPPGSDYLDREILDSAQISRFWYYKCPDDLPSDVKSARVLGIFGLRPQSTLTQNDWLSSKKAITMDQLEASDEDRRWVANRFIQLHMAIERDVNNGVIGSDQPQSPHFILDRDRMRVFSFMFRYFDGNLRNSFMRAVSFYFEGYFESDTDKERVRRKIKATLS